MRRCCIRSPRAPLLVTWVGFAIFGALGGMPAAAQNERGRRDIEAAKERIHRLQREAEELQEAGRHDKADALRHEARQLEERLDRRLERREQEERGGEASRILERLEMGMAALRELGRHEELERLEHIAAGLRERLRHQARQRRRGDDERDAALRNLKIMRYAVEALAESQHPDAADLVERALRAREMALEGRRDEEARRMRASGPDRAQLVELLAMAGEILQDRGRSERAAAVGQLSGQLHERLRRDRRRPRETDRRGGADRLQRFMERVETLEQRLTGIERMMERLHKAIETLKDDGN
ncbi:MAG: hypothetical protein IID33_00305 [Planctomycetes bacterium]|nr:hypothetical protein [Planctomycetota bacterium]